MQKSCVCGCTSVEKTQDVWKNKRASRNDVITSIFFFFFSRVTRFLSIFLFSTIYFSLENRIEKRPRHFLATTKRKREKLAYKAAPHPLVSKSHFSSLKKKNKIKTFFLSLDSRNVSPRGFPFSIDLFAKLIYLYKKYINKTFVTRATIIMSFSISAQESRSLLFQMNCFLFF